jgi:hypothetical protein
MSPYVGAYVYVEPADLGLYRYIIGFHHYAIMISTKYFSITIVMVI